MSEPQRERPEPSGERPQRKIERASSRETALTAAALACVLLVGALTISGRRAAVVPVAPPAPAAAPLQAPLPAPLPSAPLDPVKRVQSCPTYEQYILHTRSPAVSETQLIAEAACLCSLASGYNARVPPGGIRQYIPIPSCPAGSNPMPMDRDTKKWKGEWIDEPGHTACSCSKSSRVFDVVMLPYDPLPQPQPGAWQRQNAP